MTMIAEFGHYALVLALALALVQASVPMVGARTNDPVLMAVAGPTAVAQFCFIAIAFAALTMCYVRSDFSVVNVFENSHSAKPLIYKLSGVWGNHEGSMLLWVLILSLFGALVALFGGNLPARLKANVLAVQSSIAVAFVLFILVTSNPFLRIPEPPLEGRDLNPILQDPGLAIHPPLLYLGYVGLSISFSFAIAALIDGRIDAAWARWVRPWTLLAWMFLTLGIAMGSYWAYYTLGWGGWWFWDPVENASFMPWLAATARLRHRSDARRLHPGDPAAVHRWQPCAVRVARALAQTGGPVRADFARRRAGAQQPLPGECLCHRVHRYALSARARGAHRRENFRRRAVLQRHLRPAVRSAPHRHAVWSAACLEARRPARRRSASGRRRGHRRDRRCRDLRHGRRRPALGAVRDRSCALRHGRRVDRNPRAHRSAQGSARDRVRARARFAAFGLGRCLCAFRARDHAAWRHRRDAMEPRADCGTQTRTINLDPPL